MSQAKIPAMFKRKVLELVDQLEAKFPVLSFSPTDSLTSMSGGDMLARYVETVSKPYSAHIMARDESFFLSVPASDVQKVAHEVDASMLTMIRAFWKDLSPEDKDAVWGFFLLFERLVAAMSPT
jgi:hypothetical protein